MEDLRDNIFRQSFPDRYADVANWVKEARLDLQYIDYLLSNMPSDSPTPSLKPDWAKSSGIDASAYTRHGLEQTKYEIPNTVKRSITELTQYEPDFVRNSMLENADYLLDVENVHVDKTVKDEKSLDELGELEVYNAKIAKDRQEWAKYDKVDKERMQGVPEGLSNLSRLYLENRLDISDPVNDPNLRGIDRLNNPLVYQIFEDTAEPEMDDFSMNRTDITDPDKN